MTPNSLVYYSQTWYVKSAIRYIDFYFFPPKNVLGFGRGEYTEKGPPGFVW